MQATPDKDQAKKMDFLLYLPVCFSTIGLDGLSRIWHEVVYVRSILIHSLAVSVGRKPHVKA